MDDTLPTGEGADQRQRLAVGFEFQDEAVLAKMPFGPPSPSPWPTLTTSRTLSAPAPRDKAHSEAGGGSGWAPILRRQRLTTARAPAVVRWMVSKNWSFFGETLSAKVVPLNYWEEGMVLWLAEGCGLNL
jgi:hypothetical protein